jgi:hypothetical protein
MTANRRRWALQAAAFAVLAAGALWLAGRAASADAPPKGDAAGLDLVPADGAAVVSVRLSDLWNNASFKSTRDTLLKQAPDVSEGVVKSAGVAPEEIDRITFLMPTAQPREGRLCFVTTVKPYDPKKVAEAAAPESKEEKVKGHELHAGGKGASVAFLTDRTYVVGAEDEVRQYLNGGAPAKEGPLAAALEAAGKHTLAAGLDVQAAAKTMPDNASAEAAALAPLFKARSALATADVGDEVKAEVRVTFEGEMDAKNGEKAMESALDLARAGLVLQMQAAAKQPGLGKVMVLLESVQAGVRAAKVERSGAEVTASGSAKLDLDKSGPTVLDAIQKVREAAARTQGANNLKQLGLAMHNYNDSMGRFPANAIYDKNGKPLLSWRVAILPYIDQQELYKQFKLDEPWDSDNNKKLLEKMPKLFASPEDEGTIKNHETHYQGFYGKGAFFEGDKGVKVADITDGLSNTLMIVEAKTSVPWTKPEDVAFDQGKLVPKVGGLRERVFQAAMGDGSVRGIPMSIKEETLRAAITRNGGEFFGADW